jgi:DNA-binding NarL/FixJ family response regulator
MEQLQPGGLDHGRPRTGKPVGVEGERRLTTTRRARILVADDHAVLTDGIVRILEDHHDVVGAVADGSALLEATERLHPDVIVADISMPTVSGLEGLRQLKAKPHDVSVIFLTMHADPRLAAEAFRLGAKGFVLKHTSGDELLKAIDAVLHGHKFMSSALTHEVLALMSSPEEAHGPVLNARQIEVLRLIVNGQRIKEIAGSLNISPRTAETIKYDIMRHLNVHSTAELVKYALEHKLIPF